MKNRMIVLLLGLGLVTTLTSSLTLGQESEGSSATVQNLGFKFESGESKLEVVMDKDFTFEKTVSEADKQVVIEIKNAKIGKKWNRRIDTSQHKSNISLISPYQSGDVVRIVLQLKENGPVEITQEGSKLVALIDNKQPVENSKKSNNADAEVATTNNMPDAEEEPVEEESKNEGPVQIGNNNNPNAKEAIDEFIATQKTKTYVGKKIFLQLRDADLIDVFRVISEASEFNIILGEEVKGRVTLNLSDVPWDQALDLILHSNKLGAERNGNVLRVSTIDGLTREKEAELVAQKAAEAAEPLVVKIFPISYAKIEDLKKILEEFLSRELNRASNGTIILGSSASKRGSIQSDPRTNSLIVRDTPSTIEKVKKILLELDTQTPQILIEGKFVEVSESNSKAVQGRIFTSSREFASATAGAATGSFNLNKNNFGANFGGSTASDTPFAVTAPSTGGAAFGFAPRTGLLPGISEFGALLTILENESQAKVIASPRVVAQNKETAEITQGQTAMFPTPAGANAAGGFQTVTLTLKLNVTPQVTNDGSILLKINFSQDTPSNQPLAAATLSTDTKKIESTVLIDSGATLVIGGIYTDTLNTSEAGIPLLRNLPIIGALFGSKEKLHTKKELFIFLTPRVLNEKEAGIRG